MFHFSVTSISQIHAEKLAELIQSERYCTNLIKTVICRKIFLKLANIKLNENSNRRFFADRPSDKGMFAIFSFKCAENIPRCVVYGSLKYE